MIGAAKQRLALGRGLLLELLEEAHVSLSSLKEVKVAHKTAPSAPMRGR
jgi:hypothetical protein